MMDARERNGGVASTADCCQENSFGGKTNGGRRRKTGNRDHPSWIFFMPNDGGLLVWKIEKVEKVEYGEGAKIVVLHPMKRL